MNHRDTLETRRLIEASSKETREQTARQLDEHRKDTIDRLDRLSEELGEHKRNTASAFEQFRLASDAKFDAVISSLGDTRERLARIEGFLRIGLSAHEERQTSDESA